LLIYCRYPQCDQEYVLATAWSQSLLYCHHLRNALIVESSDTISPLLP
jgi:hypothetical protein